MGSVVGLYIFFGGIALMSAWAYDVTWGDNNDTWMKYAPFIFLGSIFSFIFIIWLWGCNALDELGIGKKES